MKSSGIGGQAVIEGVMMKNKSSYAVAVRTAEGEIAVSKGTFHGVGEKNVFFRLPVVRGVVAFVESMILGMKTLTYSASFYEEEEEKREKKDEAKESAVMIATVILSILAAVGIFMILPLFLSELFRRVTTNVTVLAVIEGVIRIALFIGYVLLISMVEDIKRVFMYHGAEHKTINCVENGLELTVANVKKQSKHHKRCGTSFMFIVMFISIIFFIFIHVENIWLRALYRLILVPVVAGVSYELIKLAGKYDNLFVRIVSAPGVALQRMTTREPDDSMIEVAIRSVEEVFDWRAFQKRMKDEKRRKENLKKHGIDKVKSDNKKKKSEKVQEIKRRETEHAKRAQDAKKERAESEALEKAFHKNVEEAKKRKARRMADVEKQREDARKKNVTEEKDEILDNLDRFFDEEKRKEKEEAEAEKKSAGQQETVKQKTERQNAEKQKAEKQEVEKQNAEKQKTEKQEAVSKEETKAEEKQQNIREEKGVDNAKTAGVEKAKAAGQKTSSGKPAAKKSSGGNNAKKRNRKK